MTVYPEMNNKIVELLRMGDTPVELYAAQRIEELELKNKELIDRVLEIIDSKQYVSKDARWNRLWNIVKECLKVDILALKGEHG